MEQISEKEMREIRKELDTIRALATIKYPLFASLLRKCKIVADSTVPRAAVDTENVMRINPEYLKKGSDLEKLFTYCHEAGHIGFSHPQRALGKDPDLVALAYDCPINAILFANGFDPKNHPRHATPEIVAPLIKKREEEVKRMSPEEIYRLLEQRRKDKKPGDKEPEVDKELRDIPTKPEDSKKQENEKNVIQQGDPKAYKDGMGQEEKEEYWRQALVQAAMQAKMAGQLPAEAELLIGDLLKPKCDWRSLIKKLILNGFGRNIISTWKKKSRKHPILPGTTRLAKPNTHILVDTSGSTCHLMPQFLGDTYGILKNQGTGIVYPWDALAYEPIELKKAVDLGLAIKEKKIRGGGGTVILPVLAFVLKAMKPNDIIVIITDGEIYDLRRKETQELLRKVAQRSGQAIFGSLRIDVEIPPRWKKVKIEP